MKGTRKAKPAGVESRERAWETTQSGLKLEFLAFADTAAIQQEMVKSTAGQAKQWGLDLEKITRMSRDAFERAGKAAAAGGSPTPAAAAKGRAR